MTSTILVDAHAHVWLKGMPKIPHAKYALDYDFTPQQYLAELDRHGIHFGVIAAASPFGDYNDYMIESIRGNARLRGTVIVDPRVERCVLERMHDDGVVGIRLPYYGTDLPDLTSWDYRRLLRRVADLDWHVHVYLEGPRLPPVIRLLEDAGVKIVIDHFGMPDPAQGIQCAGFQATMRSIEKGRTWIKVSGGYRIGKPLGERCGRELLRQVGPDRLLWASDCPFAGHENTFAFQDTIDTVHAWVPEGPARDRIFGLNALELCFT